MWGSHRGLVDGPHAPPDVDGEDGAGGVSAPGGEAAAEESSSREDAAEGRERKRRRRQVSRRGLAGRIDGRRAGDWRGKTAGWRLSTLPLAKEHSTEHNDGGASASHIGSMLEILTELEANLYATARRCRTKADTMSPAETASFSQLVKRLDDALAAPDGEAAQDAFIDLDGPRILQRVLGIPLPSTGTGGDLSREVEDALALSLKVLADVCNAAPARTASLSRSRGFMQNLFNTMRYPALLDWSLGLLLAAGDQFPLESVDDLPGLISSLTPKGLALFCRALASIFSKNDEAALDGVPPPECIPPNLCVVCVNRALLLEIDTFVPRVIRLLDVKRPPSWLCPIPQPDEPELDTWEGLDSRAEQPDRAVLVTEDQLPPGLERTAVSMPIQGTQMYVVRLSEFSVRICTTHKQTPACPTTRPYPAPLLTHLCGLCLCASGAGVGDAEGRPSLRHLGAHGRQDPAADTASARQERLRRGARPHLREPDLGHDGGRLRAGAGRSGEPKRTVPAEKIRLDTVKG